MKLEAKTLQILKNYSAINPSLFFKKGNCLATIDPNSSIIAYANLEQEIPKSFAVYELSRFLSTLSLFDSPELEITDKSVIVSQGKRKINYTLTEPSLLVTPPEGRINFKNPQIQFDLPSAKLQEIQKALSVLSLPEICVNGDGQTISIIAMDHKNPTGDTYSVEVGETQSKFKMFIRSEYLKFIPGDYQVEISTQPLSRFKGDIVEYFIAVEQHSSYQG